jgi:RNA polymerase sigma-70 factor, ECF subfamily
LEDETAVIRRAQQQDRAACDALVQRYREPVYRLAYLLVGDAHVADDITQQTFLRAFGHLDRFDTRRPLRPWLLQITRNLARNRHRAFKRYVQAMQRFALAQPEPERVETQVQAQQQATHLWQVVRRLPAPQQELIYLRFFLDLSVEETAAVLDLPPGTVKSRTHRTLRRLRGLIDRYAPELAP